MTTISSPPFSGADIKIAFDAQQTDLTTHAAVTSGAHGISAFGATLVDDADAATARATLNVDPAGTDNSTNVTFAGAYDYLTLSGQQITLGQIDLTTDVTGVLPVANYATGTPDGTKFVRDDGTLVTPPQHDSVTLTGAYDYLTLSGQEITLDQVDLTTDVTGVLPVANYATGTPDGKKFVRDDGVLTKALPAEFNTATLAYAATVNLDMAALTGEYRTLSLTGDVTFTTSNRAAGRTVVIRIISDGTLRSFTFPAWDFIGSGAPVGIAPNSKGVLSLSFFGTADTDCIAVYSDLP